MGHEPAWLVSQHRVTGVMNPVQVSMGLTVDSPAYSGGDEDVVGRGGTRLTAKRQQGVRGGGSQQPYNSEAAAKLQLLAKLVREVLTRGLGRRTGGNGGGVGRISRVKS